MKLSIFRFCLTLFCVFLTTGNANAKANAEPLDQIVVTINDAVITQTELNQALVRAKKQLADAHAAPPSTATLNKQVLDQLINRRLQLQLAEQAGITINDSEVEKAIKQIAEGNHLTTAELYKKVTDTQGLSINEFEQEIHDELVMQHIQQQEVSAHIRVTPEEVNDFMRTKEWQASNGKEYHLEDILVPIPEAPTTQDIQKAKQEADAVINKLHNGTSFASIAAAESSSSQALNGGDLGWRKLPEVPSIFAYQIVNMKQGAIMGPIRAPNGFHIIHLAGIRSVATAPAGQQQKQIQQLVFERKFEEALENWIKRIRSQAVIHYL